MRKRTILVAVVLSVLVGMAPVAHGTPTVRWTRSIGNGETDVVPDGRGATFVSGTIWERDEAGMPWASAFVRKLGPKGGERWTRMWRPPRVHAHGTSIALAPDGTVYLGGTIQPPPGECSGWFLRAYGPHGDLLWHREQRGARTCETGSWLVSLDATDHLVVAGGGDWRGGWGMTDGWVRAYAPDGSFRWVRALEMPGFGTNPYTAVAEVAIDVDDDVYVAGSVGERPADHSMPVDLDPVLQSLSSAGEPTWTRRFDDRHAEEWDFGSLTSVDVRGSMLLVAGSSQRPGRASPDLWVARLGPDGGTRWARHISDGDELPSRVLARVSPGGGEIAAWQGPKGVIVVAAFGPGGRRTWRTEVAASEGRSSLSGLDVDTTAIAIGGWHLGRMESSGTGRVWMLGPR